MARDFNGTNQYLSIGSAIVTAYPFTIATRFIIDVASGAHTFLGVFNNTTGDSMYLTTGDSGGQHRLSAAVNDGSGFRHALTGNAVPTGVWCTGVGRFISATSRNTVLNGNFANAGSNTVSATPTGLNVTEFGRYGPFNTSFLNGRGAEIAVWDIAVPDWVITAFHQGWSPQQLMPQNLVAHWELYGNESPERNLMDNAAFFTLNNAPTKAAHPPILSPTSGYIFGPTDANITLQGSPAAQSASGTGAALKVISHLLGSPGAQSASLTSATLKALVGINSNVSAQSATLASAALKAIVSLSGSPVAQNASMDDFIGEVEQVVNTARFRRWWLGTKLRQGGGSNL